MRHLKRKKVNENIDLQDIRKWNIKKFKDYFAA